MPDLTLLHGGKSTPTPVTPRTRVDPADALEINDELARHARDDINAFCEMVLRDESTQQPIIQAPFHEEWHALADQHDRLAITSSLESGKSQQLSVARTLWELGHDPTLRFTIVSGTDFQAAKISTLIKQYAETSPELRRIFPDLMPAEPWGMHYLTFKRPIAAKEPSIQITSVGTSRTVGTRFDRVVLDDILTPGNTDTAENRKKVKDWYHANIGARASDARIIAVGNTWHPDDLLHELAKTPGWMAKRYPILREDGTPAWPERWPMEAIERKRQELSLHPIEFARQFMCVARDEGSARFKRDWIDQAMARGANVPLYPSGKPPDAPQGSRFYVGVDLAVQLHAAADLTVLYSLMVRPDGTRQPLWIESGRWSGREIVDRVVTTAKRYGAITWCENVAAQDYLVQEMRERVSVRPFTTGRGQASLDFQAEHLGTELSAGKWIIPSQGGVLHSEVQSWVDDMLAYDPRSHCGDRLAASLFASHGARDSTSVPVLTGAVVSPVSWAGRIR